MTHYEMQIWADIRDLLKQLVENQDKLIELYIQQGLEMGLELEKEGEGRNKLGYSYWAAGLPEGMQTELSNKDVS